MKKIYTIMMTMAVLFSFSSCDEDIDIDTLLGKMSAQIDGVEWSVSATDVSNGLGGVAAIYAEEKFAITGTSTEGKTIIIVINGINEATYDLSPLAGEANAATIYRVSVDDDATNSYYSTLGSVTITEKTDNRISGTFYFTAAKSIDDIVQITNGNFENVVYTAAENLPIN